MNNEIKATAPSPTDAARWTCPMHPEIIQDAPRNCPICGMALEPVLATTSAHVENPEVQRLKAENQIVAMESAGVTLVKGDLRAIASARKLSRVTMRNIRQNLVFAFAYNSLGVAIAAGALYPMFGLLLSPMFAAFAMSASSVSVIGNALRLRRMPL